MQFALKECGFTQSGMITDVGLFELEKLEDTNPSYDDIVSVTYDTYIQNSKFIRNGGKSQTMWWEILKFNFNSRYPSLTRDEQLNFWADYSKSEIRKWIYHSDLERDDTISVSLYYDKVKKYSLFSLQHTCLQFQLIREILVIMDLDESWDEAEFNKQEIFKLDSINALSSRALRLFSLPKSQKTPNLWLPKIFRKWTGMKFKSTRRVRSKTKPFGKLQPSRMNLKECKEWLKDHQISTKECLKLKDFRKRIKENNKSVTTNIRLHTMQPTSDLLLIVPVRITSLRLMLQLAKFLENHFPAHPLIDRLYIVPFQIVTDGYQGKFLGLNLGYSYTSGWIAEQN